MKGPEPEGVPDTVAAEQVAEELAPEGGASSLAAAAAGAAKGAAAEIAAAAYRHDEPSSLDGNTHVGSAAEVSRRRLLVPSFSAKTLGLRFGRGGVVSAVSDSARRLGVREGMRVVRVAICDVSGMSTRFVVSFIPCVCPLPWGAQ